MRPQITVSVFDAEQYETDWPPEELTDFISWIFTKLATIPTEHRANAKITFSAEEGYDSWHPRIRIDYTRMQTVDEATLQQYEERQNQERQKAMELKTLAALKAKYE